ncbi:hypothetical protein ABZ329_31385 [Streptomyces rubiginosohelvolus]|uniref:hypothetical protein n=1 Tax=Streptomyces rubiginosohelvolus TaxID=67362 RepID=UPI0033C94445
MTWRTVKQPADAAAPEELFTGQWQNRPSILDDYKPNLDDRWNEGCTNAWKLRQETVPLGYKGSYQRVRAYLHKKRTSPRPEAARPPSPRTVAGWILRRPETLPEPEQLLLKAVRTHCPETDALTRHVRAFAVILTERQSERLPDWLVPSGRTICSVSIPLPPASTATAMPSSPVSPCPGAQAQSKATSTASK